MAKLKVQFHDMVHGTQEIPADELEIMATEMGVALDIGTQIRMLQASNAVMYRTNAGCSITWHLEYD